ncbi:MAG: TapB family protein [bacterium]
MKMIVILSVSIISFFVITCEKEEWQDLTKYIPNGDQSFWVYKVAPSDGEPYTLTEKLNGTEDIEGFICQVLETTISKDPSFLSEDFLIDNDKDSVKLYGTANFTNGIEDYRASWDPALLMFSFPFFVGQEWKIFDEEGMKPTETPFMGEDMDDDDIDDDGQDDTVDITINAKVELTEDVTVPAGTFKDTFKIKYEMAFTLHLSSQQDPWFTYVTNYNWYKPYVGRVKGSTTIDMPEPFEDYQDIEELTSYELH